MAASSPSNSCLAREDVEVTEAAERNGHPRTFLAELRDSARLKLTVTDGWRNSWTSGRSQTVTRDGGRR
jgi:hypothetical protein